MRTARQILLISFCSLVISCGGAYAMEVVNPPPPNFQLTFAIDPADVGSLKKILLKLSKDWNFVSYSNVPRAKGKFFFLGLRRSEELLIFAEGQTAGSPVWIDFYKVSESSPDIQPIERSLESALRQRWPNLAISVRLRASN